MSSLDKFEFRIIKDPNIFKFWYIFVIIWSITRARVSFARGQSDFWRGICVPREHLCDKEIYYSREKPVRIYWWISCRVRQDDISIEKSDRLRKSWISHVRNSHAKRVHSTGVVFLESRVEKRTGE